MKNTLLSLMLIIAALKLYGQQNQTLKVESYKLDNGFTIFLNPDQTATRVYGAVMVNAGAKHEDPDATGMAHYLEHLLFKGTTDLGTYNYEKEKPHLDSINILYEVLAKATSDESRLRIQKQINQQALKASKYGLPNEFDKLLRSIGSTGINAFTNYEMTFYHNSFPAHEMNKWLNIYSTRFRNPVFRSFQSELEVVYEEKNRSLDDFERKIGEKIFEYMFSNLPYGQWSVLGKVEHLKTPSLIKMYEFYEKNYVSENMALILSGNFDPKVVKPLITSNFKDFRTGTVEKLKLPPLTPFNGVEKHNARMTPVKVGFTGFQTAPEDHPDRAALDVYEYMLSNNSGTGMIDQLMQNNEMLYAGTIPASYNDAGGLALFYVPKILTQSLGGAEKKFLKIIEEINSGGFDEQLFQIAKNELQVSFEKRLASITSRGRMIGVAFNQGKTWEEYIAYPDHIAAVSKEDLIRVGKKYFGENRMKFISRTGFPKKRKLKKPPYKPIVTDQKESSTYAENFEEIPSLPFNPKYLDFENDTERDVLKGDHRMFVSKNPVNDLFDFTIRFKKGRLNESEVPTISGILDHAGAGEYDRITFKKMFAIEGVDYSVWSDANHLSFNISGKEEAFDKGLELINLLITKPKLDEQSKKSYVNSLFGDRKLEKNDPNFMSRALFFHGLYGDESPQKSRKSSAEIKKLDLEKITQIAKEITRNYSSDIIYHGQLGLADVKGKIDQYLNLTDIGKAEDFIYQPAIEVSENKIYIVNDKKAVQSQIYFYVMGDKFEKEDYAINNAFNQYFSGGFSGLVLQEIREYRSLAYSASANYNAPLVPDEKGRLYAFIGCQSDKTNDAISVMHDLLKNMPEREERVDALKNSLQLKVVTEYPEPSDISIEIMDLERKGYESDPNEKAFNRYQEITMDDIVSYFEKSIKGRPIVITIYGDQRNIDREKLKAIGEVIELKKSDIANF